MQQGLRAESQPRFHTPPAGEMETRREPLQPQQARLPPGLQLIKTEGKVLNNPFVEQNTRSQNPADKHNKTDFMVPYEKTING